jgi:hypothetical protein
MLEEYALDPWLVAVYSRMKGTNRA